MMTVKDLKKLLNRYPQETPIVVQNGVEDQEIISVIKDVSAETPVPQQIAIIVVSNKEKGC